MMKNNRNRNHGLRNFSIHFGLQEARMEVGEVALVLVTMGGLAVEGVQITVIARGAKQNAYRLGKVMNLALPPRKKKMK